MGQIVQCVPNISEGKDIDKKGKIISNNINKNWFSTYLYTKIIIKNNLINE